MLSLLAPDDTAARKRRRRRKRRKKRGKKRCKAASIAQACAGKCGAVTNNCRQQVECGSCACNPTCAVCFTCQGDANTPGSCVVDTRMIGKACGTPGQICHADGACAGPPAISSFTATPGAIVRSADPPETALLSWDVIDATTCTLESGKDTQEVPCTGSLQVGPDATTVYTLRASGPEGSTSAEATVAVTYCHSVTSPDGDCTTQDAAFCVDHPIDATSQADAFAACEACYGDGQCSVLNVCGGGGSTGSVQGPEGTRRLFAHYHGYEPGTIRVNGTALEICTLTGARWAPKPA